LRHFSGVPKTLKASLASLVGAAPEGIILGNSAGVRGFSNALTAAPPCQTTQVRPVIDSRYEPSESQRQANSCHKLRAPHRLCVCWRRGAYTA